MPKHIQDFINLTPHAVRVYPHGDTKDGIWVEVPPSGTVARVEVSEEDAGSISCASGRPAQSHLEFGGSTCWQAVCTFTDLGEVAGLPEDPTVPVIVSSMVLDRLHGTGREAYAPDTGPTCVRDEGGRILGVRRFKKARP